MKKIIPIFISLFLLSCDGHKKDIKTENQIEKIGISNKIIGTENLVQPPNSTENNHWLGTYKLNIDYGKLDNVSEMSINYDIEITNGKCTFSGMGYKTYFTDLCKIEKNGNQLTLKYIKAIDGDGFSDHSNLTNLGSIIHKEGKYYLKSPVVADNKWNYDKELLMIKND